MNLFLSLPTSIEYLILSYCTHPLASLIKNKIKEIHVDYYEEEIKTVGYPFIFFEHTFYVNLRNEFE